MSTLPSQGQLLYHITHIDNMPSILKNGLVSRKTLLDNNINTFVDIADQEILNKRIHYKENLSKYVLFHFYAKNPFDYAVTHKYGAKNLVIITIKRSFAKMNNFKIIPSHPLDKNEPEILPYEQGIKKIRWDIIDDILNRNYSIQEIRTACMAECVLEYMVQPEVFAYVNVFDEVSKQKILKMDNSAKVTISVSPYLFYNKKE